MPEPVAMLDAAAAADAARALRPCCASDRWIESLLAARPLGSMHRLVEVSDDAIAALGWADITQALDAHPRIGERRSGADAEARWSREEQSAAGSGADATKQALVEGNVAYEERFGHVFLIRAAGRSAEEMLARLQQRLHNPPEIEREVVRHELTEIVRLRLGKAFA
ncbi:MAG: 2-oxo-4-hydroxy-4-carboxy-5-ureidoimidazoline decarboxylase [Pseudonocardiales bacterium]|nr:2-oxo-4-hydroxy-4-carboxy-5-ureidoimidazoline decarboxylase [Pseudonocardiales bacterium]